MPGLGCLVYGLLNEVLWIYWLIWTVLPHSSSKPYLKLFQLTTVSILLTLLVNGCFWCIRWLPRPMAFECRLYGSNYSLVEQYKKRKLARWPFVRGRKPRGDFLPGAYRRRWQLQTLTEGGMIWLWGGLRQRGLAKWDNIWTVSILFTLEMDVRGSQRSQEGTGRGIDVVPPPFPQRREQCYFWYAQMRCVNHNHPGRFLLFISNDLSMTSIVVRVLTPSLKHEVF